MSWQKEVDEIKKRKALALAQGGAEAIQVQHEKGRLTIRERIDAVLDADSFVEQGPGAGFASKNEQGDIDDFSPANYVVGFGQINGSQVVVGGEDFTLKGGSPNAAGLRKSIYAEELALHFQVPLIRLLEGGGGSVAKPGGSGPKTVGAPVFSEPRFKVIADALGQIPVVSAGLGPVAGFPAGRLAASHFSVMVKQVSQVMVAGPALVERALGRRLTKEELGGYRVHEKSGVVDAVVDSEEAAFAVMRQFLSYLPQNVFEVPVRLPSEDRIDRAEEGLLDIVPRDVRRPFDMRKLVRWVVDTSSFLELAPKFGRGQIIGLARLNGLPVGVIANDCRHYAGAMTAQGSQKAKRLMELCETFHLPIINFLDEPGFMLGPDAEQAGTIRYGMSAVAAAAQSSVPWATIAIHKSFGVASAAHFAPNTYKLAWPSYELGALPVQGGVAVAFRREIEAAADPEAARKAMEAALLAERSPFPLMESFSIHELIDPRETRAKLCQWSEWIEPKLNALKGPATWGYRP
ncbi:MAG: propionyl-CoA carboxylase [Gammaproteobacteria bacterium]|jgi:acetyl-CoA carboxylase carboxyltransferase component|nr:propionyl-CoA carboxylase [Gammaproteobacteria bacterium]